MRAIVTRAEEDCRRERGNGHDLVILVRPRSVVVYPTLKTQNVIHGLTKYWQSAQLWPDVWFEFMFTEADIVSLLQREFTDIEISE